MNIPLIIRHSAPLLVALAVSAQPPASQLPKEHTTQTRVVLLGTGTPAPDPERSGPATAIVVGDSAYLVDFGPGVVRRAKAAVLDRGITPLEPANLNVIFVTHLHSDHTSGYSDLILTGWTAGRRTPLEVYGPTGLQSMTEHILQAYRIDIETRTNPEGDQRTNPEGWKVNAHEIKSGVIYKDANAARRFLYDVPYRFFSHAFSPCRPGFADSAKQPASINCGRSKPLAQFVSHPIGNWNGSDVASLAQQIDDGPVFFPLLKMIQGQCDDFVASQATGEHEGQQSTVPFSFEPLAIRSLPKRLSLFCSQPVAESNA